MKKHVAYFGLLLALALILSYVESLIPIFVSIPGIKLGLTNLVVLVCLYFFPLQYACIISVIRVLLAGLLFGNMFSILYSLAGAMLSLVIMIVGKKILKLRILGISMLGGIFHNLGQLIVAILVVSNYRIGFLFPYLMLSGLLMGTVIGLISSAVIPYLKRVINDV